MARYEPLELDPNADDPADDLRLQVVEMETHSLIAILAVLTDGPTVFQLVSDELDYRANSDEPRAMPHEIAQIKRLLAGDTDIGHASRDDCVAAERYLDEDAIVEVSDDGEAIVKTRTCPVCERRFNEVFAFVGLEDAGSGEVLYEP